MLRSRLLTSCILLFLFITSTFSVTAFVPEDKIVINLVSNASPSVPVGSEVEVFISIKNFNNNTMRNVNVTQLITGSAKIVKSPAGNFSGPEENIGAGTFIDRIDNSSIQFSYLNVTSTNFTMGIPLIEALKTISISFTVNITKVGLGTIKEPTIRYLDHFGDPQGAKGQNILEFTGTVTELNNKIGYFPKVKVEENDFNKILFVTLGILFIALISRVIHLKKPL